MAKFIKINPSDNVAVAISDVAAGETVSIDGHEIKVKSDIPAGHKMVLEDIAAGEDIVKYGFPTGHTTEAVPQGGLVDPVSYTHLTLPTT